MAARTADTAVEIEGPAGRLEGILEAPQTDAVPDAVAVVCHPHPQHQGTMRNKVVHTVARACNRMGLPALRFNYRGVGASEGAYDEGDGETLDVIAAARWMRDRYPDAELWLAGFSFGAWVSIRAAAELEPARLISVAPPVSRFDMQRMEQPRCPWLIVQGEADELVDAGEVLAWVNGLEPGPELVMLPEVDHFFHGKLVDLRETLIENLRPGQGSS